MTIVKYYTNPSVSRYFFIFTILLFSTSLYSSPRISKHNVKKIIRNGNLSEVTLLINKVPDMNKTFYGDKNLLHWAIWYNRFSVVKLLVSKGANVNEVDKDNRSPLCMSTSTYSRNDSTSEFLINNNADPNISSLWGYPTILNVARMGQYGASNEYLFKLLLDKGAEIDVTGCGTASLFLTCCGWGTPKMLQYLLDKGVSVNETDGYSRNGLAYAIIKLPGSIYVEPKKYANRRIDVINFLIEKGIDLNHKDVYGKDINNYAWDYGNEEIRDALTKYLK